LSVEFINILSQRDYQIGGRWRYIKYASLNVRGAAQKSAARMKMPAPSYCSPALLSTMRVKKTKYDISPTLKGSFDSLSVECVCMCPVLIYACMFKWKQKDLSSYQSHFAAAGDLDISHFCQL
jgi:hypothetical protein